MNNGSKSYNSTKTTFQKGFVYNPDTNDFEVKKMDLYESVNQYHPKKHHDIRVLDPVFANPNSYENLIAILHRIGYISGIKKYSNKNVSSIVTVGGICPPFYSS